MRIVNPVVTFAFPSGQSRNCAAQNFTTRAKTQAGQVAAVLRAVGTPNAAMCGMKAVKASWWADGSTHTVEL
jgi:hypothetical protein